MNLIYLLPWDKAICSVQYHAATKNDTDQGHLGDSIG